jgi:hypothetical protein
VQCVENDIKVLDATNNFLYFTTDTKKIYLGKNNKFLPMCASSGIFYGTKKIYYDNSGETPSPDVDFSFSLEIEGDEIPEVDDLILNGEGDGCFYRVLSIIGDTVSTKRLTLRGGGGGGGSEGGEAQGKPHYSLGIITTNPTYSSEADKMPFRFKANYAGTAEDYITKVSIHRGSQELGTFETTPFYEIE